MAAAKFVLKSKYVHQIHFYTVHSIILCIHSKASIKFINPFQICSKITKFNYVYEKLGFLRNPAFLLKNLPIFLKMGTMTV